MATILVCLSIIPTPITGQTASELSVPSQAQAKDVALSALKILHENQISKLYRDLISDLQKKTGLTTEAKAVTAFSPTARNLPGAPAERILLFARYSQTLPVFFQDQKGNFYSFVFHSKYPTGEFNEEVYLVYENEKWKVAGLIVRQSL